MEQEKQFFFVWWRDHLGIEYPKQIYAGSIGKAKYKAFIELKEDGEFEDTADFGWFLKYVFVSCKKI